MCTYTLVPRFAKRGSLEWVSNIQLHKRVKNGGPISRKCSPKSSPNRSLAKPNIAPSAVQARCCSGQSECRPIRLPAQSNNRRILGTELDNSVGFDPRYFYLLRSQTIYGHIPMLMSSTGPLQSTEPGALTWPASLRYVRYCDYEYNKFTTYADHVQSLSLPIVCPPVPSARLH